MRGKLIYWSVMAVVVFVLAELGMLLIEPYTQSDFYEYDKEIGFRVKGHAYGTNAFGFNDKDYTLADSPDTNRILILGDSYSWAGGLDSNYTALLEKQLNQEANLPWQVVNAGYSMTHTGEQLALLKKFGLQYKPDQVIVGFFCGNDFIDASPYRKRIVLHGTYFDIDKRNERFFLGRPFVLRSRLFYFFKQKLVVLFNTDNSVEDRRKRKESGCLFTESTFLEVDYYRLKFCNKKLQKEGMYSENINYIFENMREIKSLLDKRGIQMSVAIFPAEYQVDDAHYKRILDRYGKSDMEFDRFLPQQILSDFLRKENINYLDLLPAFREHNDKSLYLCRNTHWNYQGNKLAADILESYLLEN